MPGHVDPSLATLIVFGVLALAAGGIFTIRKGDRQKGLLMIACAIVVLGNLVIWTIPV
jgi:hypothetical protein